VQRYFFKHFEYGLGMKVEMALHLLALLMPEFRHRVVELILLVEQSIACGCQEYGEKEAVRWADGFRFPKDISKRDYLELSRCKFDLAALVRKRHNLMKKKRLSLMSMSRIRAFGRAS